MSTLKNGWDWFAVNEPPPSLQFDPLEDGDELTALAARCFKGKDGDRLLGHLRSMTVERALGPTAEDALLRHLEGQRQLVAHLTSLVERGRTPRID